MTDLFPRVGRWHRGYDPQQVHKFLEQARVSYESDDDSVSEHTVRAAAFDVVVDGYQTATVDAALDRLEAAIVRRRRARFVSSTSEDQWMARAADRATTLYPRLQRPAGERFADAKGQGYGKQDVDALLDSLVDYFEHGTPVSAQQVRLATFRTARGRNAYDEAVVDTYLDRAVEVLLAVE